MVVRSNVYTVVVHCLCIVCAFVGTPVTPITYGCRRLPTQTHSDLPRGNRCRWCEGNTHPNGAPAYPVVVTVGRLVVVVVVVVMVAGVVLEVLPDHNWPTMRRR